MTYIGLLRAINVASHNRIGMPALRGILTDLGMRDVRTLVQSGNVVFATRERPTPALERLLERATAERLGVSTDYVVRTPEEWQEVIAGNPFQDEARARPNLTLVMALKTAPARRASDALMADHDGPELARIRGRHVYIVYPDGVGRSRLTGAVIEKRLGTRGTARNWNTVLKLAAMVG